MKHIGLRWLGWMLACVLLVSTVPAMTVVADTAAEFTYTVGEDQTATITRYTGTAEEVVVPSVIDGYPVKTIGYGALQHTRNLKSVTISEGIQIIERAAFNCSHMVDISIPDSVTYIGTSAFDGCRFLKSVAIPDNVTVISQRAFFDCHVLENVVFPANLETIESGAFSRCYALTELTLPDTLTTVGRGAFELCTGLTSAKISRGMTEVADSMFMNCYNLQNVQLHENILRIGNSAFWGCKKLSSVDIPDSVTQIGNSAFSGCAALKSVGIPDSVTQIGNSAFSDCDALTELTIPDGITTVPTGLVDSCDELQTVYFNPSVTEIGAAAFRDCRKLCNIPTLLEVTSIGKQAFRDCFALRSVWLSNKLKMIDEYNDCATFSSIVFVGTKADWDTITIKYGSSDFVYTTHYYVEHIVNDKDVVYGLCYDGTACVLDYTGSAEELTLPADIEGYSLTEVATQAFRDCKTLKSVVLPKGLLRISESAFNGCENLQQLSLPDGLKTIGVRAFYGNKSLKDVKIPHTVTKMETEAFGACSSLKNVRLSKNVKNLELGLFADCTALVSVEIPEGVTEIWQSTFSNCTSLKTVYIPISLKRVSTNAFINCSSIETVYYNGNEANWKSISIEAVDSKDWYFMSAPRKYYAVQKYGELLYRANGDQTFTVVDIVATAKSVTVPEKIGNRTLKDIKEDAFEGRSALEMIKFFGSEAEWNSLTKQQVTVPEGVNMLFDLRKYPSFSDVYKNGWFFDAVQYVSVKGFMTGYKDGTFGPANTLQRQDFVVTLARIAGVDLAAYQHAELTFEDVKMGEYYGPAVAWAVDNGIITGYNERKFGVGDTVNREQVATILYRFCGSPVVENVEETLEAFPDAYRISGYAKEAMAWAVQNGVISGLKSGKIAPKSGASRAQIATIIMRMDQQGMLK